MDSSAEGEDGIHHHQPLLGSTLPFQRIKFGVPLAGPTLTARVFKATIDSKEYAVKLFEPFDAESRDINRSRLRRYKLSDAELEARFHPWRREVRVYEHIDRTEEVPIIILELLDGIEIHNKEYDLHTSDLTRQTAQGLYNDGLDAEYVHIYVHCMEKIEALHDARIIQSDIKPDVFMNHASVLCDFSHAWSWDKDNDEPCLDSFKPRLGPRSFETRSKGERKALQRMVITEYNGNNPTKCLQFEGYTPEPFWPGEYAIDGLRNRVPSWRECSRCRKMMDDIVSTLGSVKRAEAGANNNEFDGIEEIHFYGQELCNEPTS